MRTRRHRKGLFWLLVLFAGLSPQSAAKAEIGDLVADGVIGQSSFTDSVALAIGPASLGKPNGIAIDPVNDRVYVSDTLNHRVLGWSNASALTTGAPADLVIGQADFTSYGCNRSADGSQTPVTLDSLCGPKGLAVDNTGALYVADEDNCRVLVFNDPYATDATADYVLGQADGSCNGTIVNANRLFLPRGVVVDSARNVYVADSSTCRVLEFDGPLSSTDTTADRVFGQSDFTSRNCAGVYYPYSVSLSASGDLYIGSTSRVYVFQDPLGGATARPSSDRTLGSTGCNTNGETASSTCYPVGVTTDASGRLFVADAGNNRILQFDTPLTVTQASRVFGQTGFGPPPGGVTFCGNESCNVGGASASSLCTNHYEGTEISCSVNWAAAVATDAAGGLWVADGFNNRILRYDQAATGDRVADLVLGHSSMTDTREPVVPVAAPSVALSSSSYRALAIELDNSRVLVYAAYSSAYQRSPIAVLGQPDGASTGCNTGGRSARSLCNPRAAIEADGRLWIADTGNNRVLRFDYPWLTWDYGTGTWTLKRDADYVFGQPDFTSGTCRQGADGLCAPSGLAVDALMRLYISDSGNNRIVIDENPLTIDPNAERVLGQPDFNTTSCTPGSGGASSLCDPRGLAVISDVDGWGIDQGDDLYVADRGNHRVVQYVDVQDKLSGAAADGVFGQSDLNSGSCGQGAGGLCSPSGVDLDRGGNLLVADTGNHRVLEYIDPRTDATADRVIGQADFTGSACNRGSASPTAESLCEPTGVAALGAYEGSLFVGDTSNNRVLRFDAPYCIETFSLTAANRGIRGTRSKPVGTKIKVNAGLDPLLDDDTIHLSGKLVLLENDGAVYPNDGPLFTLAADESFSSGIVFSESVPNWISNVRSTNNGGTWTTDELEASRGITYYRVSTNFHMPGGFSDAPQYDSIKYKARAVGMNVASSLPQRPWFRAQYGSTCFVTEMSCRLSLGGRSSCSPAR